MRVFFYNHIDFITEEAQMPDVRIYAINYKEEANRHYIDLEMLHNTSYEKMPGTLAEAKAKFGDSLLQKSGLLPWYIDDIITKLTKAFHDKNKPYILFQAGDLAHYIGDAHMPLHTTINHDGQLSGQKEFILSGKLSYLKVLVAVITFIQAVPYISTIPKRRSGGS
ncbi:MAG: hypothetical protein WKG06_42505 [Segetibacter sp.]